ncbi:MAG: allantoicase [Ignavibacteriales bacterium]|nr:allantoicase [Ignavibacteriales bacterium]
MSSTNTEPAVFPTLIDLAAERIGGKALLASDDFFAEKENLLKPGRGIFIPGKYTNRGKLMDGWESRRKRARGHDWCIIQLGAAGIIKGVDIDTNFFLGNNPAYASIEAIHATSKSNAKSLAAAKEWVEILPKSPLKPGSQNIFSVSDAGEWTHVRLNIYPDGGVARFRVYGDVAPLRNHKTGAVIDLVSILEGGKAIAASDMFFSPMNNLLMPGRAADMGDGWETRRRRGPGFDWVIIKLGVPGTVSKIEVDTNHFKGNYPDSCSIEFCNEHNFPVDGMTMHDIEWKELLPKTKLKPNSRHFFEKELQKAGIATHVRLNIFPDGGVSRLRVWGKMEH